MSAGELQYEISGEGQQCLQVILEQGDSILANCNTICWMSDQIAVEKIDTFFSSALFGKRTENLRLINQNQPAKFVGLAQKCSGRVLVMKKTNNIVKGLYFFPESFVCAHAIPEISLQHFPDHGRDRNVYMTIPSVSRRIRSVLHCTPPLNSTMFFQSGSEIMTKYLPVGQCMLINLWCVVAFDDTCPVKLLNVPQITYNFVSSQGIMLRIEGPGNVYFSSHGNGPRSSQEMVPQLNNSRFFSYPFSIFLQLLFSFLILYLFLLITLRFFIDDELWEEIKQQLEQLEGNNNNQQNNQMDPQGDPQEL